MNKTKLYKNDETVIRVLGEDKEKILVIDCIKRNMPKWIDKSCLSGFMECLESDFGCSY